MEMDHFVGSIRKSIYAKLLFKNGRNGFYPIKVSFTRRLLQLANQACSFANKGRREDLAKTPGIFKMAASMRNLIVVKKGFDTIMKVQNRRNLPCFIIKTSENYRPILSMSSSLLFRRHMCQDVTTSDRIFIDTHTTVKAMEKSGLTVEEAECLTGILVKIMEKNTELNQRELVNKQQQEMVIQQVMSHIASVKKDMVILEKSEFSALRSENEKLVFEVNQLRQQLADEIQKLANTVKLDINLERSRSIEMSAGQEQELEKVTQRIRTEVANMTAKLEATKTDMIKYFAGTLLGCLTLGLGFYRILLK